MIANCSSTSRPRPPTRLELDSEAYIVFCLNTVARISDKPTDRCRCACYPPLACVAAEEHHRPIQLRIPLYDAKTQTATLDEWSADLRRWLSGQELDGADANRHSRALEPTETTVLPTGCLMGTGSGNVVAVPVRSCSPSRYGRCRLPSKLLLRRDVLAQASYSPPLVSRRLKLTTLPYSRDHHGR